MTHSGTNGCWGRRRAALLGAALLAVIIRLIAHAETREVPLVRHLIGDAAGYYEWGQRIASGAWAGSEPFYQAPLYPYVLGGMLALFGEGVWVIRVAQAIFGGAAAFLLGLGTGRLFGRGSGLVAALMLALYPPAVFFDGVIQKASLAGVLTCALIAAVEWCRKSPNGLATIGCRPSVPAIGHGAEGSVQAAAGGHATVDSGRGGAAVVLGVLCGLLVLTRENALVWIPVVGAWAGWDRWRTIRGRGPVQEDCIREKPTRDRSVGQSFRPALIAVAAFALGVCLVLLPVGVRNRVVGGEWSLSTFQSGPNFYIGNGPAADGRYRPLVRGHESPEFERGDATALAEQALGRHLSAREVSDYWWSRALEDIAADRGRWVRLMGRKLAMVWNRYEVADAESLYVYADSSFVLRALGAAWNFGLLCPLAAVGVVWTGRHWRRLWIYYALIISMALSVALFYVLARYRFVVAILLIPFAAGALAELWPRIRRGDGRGLVAGLLVGLAVGALVHWPVHDESRLNAMAWMNVGVALAREGEIDSATAYFRRAVEGHPDSAEANNNLAMALALQGHYAGAIPHYERALASAPDLMGVAYNLGVALERVGRVDEARARYQRALAQDPNDGDARAALERLGP